MNAYETVERFERRVADRFGMAHGIAVDCCTSAIFLCIKWRQRCGYRYDYATIPCRTYISVPFALQDCGLTVRFSAQAWGSFYEVEPWGVMDAAKHWKFPELVDQRQRHPHSLLWCFSFHIKKPIPIGRGGMILTDDAEAAEWLRRARYDGRSGVAFDKDNIKERGWHRYITPEQAGRGLSLMDIYPDGVDIPFELYPDLSKMEVFR